MKNNILYHHLFQKYKITQVKTIKLKVKSFQNFNEYPIFAQNKDKLINYLFDNGIETKIIQYVDCRKIFQNNSKENQVKILKTKLYVYQITKIYLKNILSILLELYLIFIDSHLGFNFE